MSNAELVAEARTLFGKATSLKTPYRHMGLKLADALEAAEAEKAALVADNAALLEWIPEWNDETDDCFAGCGGWRPTPRYGEPEIRNRDNHLADCEHPMWQDHPGAALLARLKRLEAVAEAAKAVWRDWSANEMPDPACLGCMGELNRTLEALEARDD